MSYINFQTHTWTQTHTDACMHAQTHSHAHTHLTTFLNKLMPCDWLLSGALEAWSIWLWFRWRHYPALC